MILKSGLKRVLDDWLIEWAIPGLFTTVLLVSIAHLGYCTWQSQMQTGQMSGQPQATNYAISAFAN